MTLEVSNRGLSASIVRLALIGTAGVGVGVGTVLLSGIETRWIVFLGLSLVALFGLLIVHQKERALTALFVLSFQFDIYVRFFYGRAHSDGLALSLVFLTGSLLWGWCLYSGRLRQFEWGGSMRRPIAALLGIMTISALASSERFVGLTAMAHALEYYFFYWMAFNLVRTEEQFRRIVLLLCLTLGAQSIVYYVQSALGLTFDLLGNTLQEGDIPRPGGTVSTNPAGFVSFIIPPLMIVSAVALSKNAPLPKAYATCLMLMGIVAVGLSYTRAAWIGLGLGIGTIVVIGFRGRWIEGRRVVALAILVIMGGAALLPGMLKRVAEDYGASGLAGQQTSLDERMHLNRIAIDVIAANPILGVGPGAYGHVFKGYVSEGADQWLFTVHNVFLLWAAETGVPGGLAFIILLGIGLRVAMRLSRQPPNLLSITAAGWMGGMVALIWIMLWAAWIGFSYNALLWFMLGLMDGGQRLASKFVDTTRTTRTM